MLTYQDIFNNAWQYFIVEGNEPGVVKIEKILQELYGYHNYVCTYLNKENGRKCAIGLSIPEGHPAQNCPDFFPVLVTNFPDLFDVNPHDCGDFQLALHDSMINKKTGEWSNTLEQRKEQYTLIAKRYNLQIPPEYIYVSIYDNREDFEKYERF